MPNWILIKRKFWALLKYINIDYTFEHLQWWKFFVEKWMISALRFVCIKVIPVFWTHKVDEYGNWSLRVVFAYPTWQLDTLDTDSMMTSENGNIFHVTGPWWGGSAGHRWIPLTGQWRKLFADVFFDLRLNKWFEQTIETPVIGDAIAFREV